MVEMSAAEYGLRRDPMVFGDDPNEVLELAITTAASLAELAMVDNLQVGLMSNGADAVESLARGAVEDASPVTRRRQCRGVSAGIEIAAGRGEEHLEQIHMALARVCLSGLQPVGDLLAIELPRLSRSLQVAIVTPTLGAQLAQTIESLNASRLVVSVFLVGDSPAGVEAPSSCSVHSVKAIEDLGVLAR